MILTVRPKTSSECSSSHYHFVVEASTLTTGHGPSMNPTTQGGKIDERDRLFLGSLGSGLGDLWG
jgi:hypothetical protein